MIFPDYQTGSIALERFSVFATKDRLKAYLLVPEAFRDSYPIVDELIDGLTANNVTFGVKTETVREMVRKQVCDTQVLVAEGLLPEPGVDGRLELLVDISGIGKPKMLADGSVDHKELKKVINVHKGQQLIRRIPAVQGKPGRTITDKPILPAQPQEAVLTVTGGTAISPDDPNLLIAATDGAIISNLAGGIEVRTTKVINGDIDYSTGNINFAGDLKVIGSIRSGFTVKAEGVVIITGNVEDAEVTSGGDLEIAGGAVGSGHGKLECGGALKVHHIENFAVIAKKTVTVVDSVLHSIIETEEHVQAKTIIGGRIEAWRGIVSDTIGSSTETKTILKVGNVFLLIQQQNVINAKLDELAAQRNEDKETLYSFVKEKMNPEGVLQPAEVNTTGFLLEKIKKEGKDLAALESRMAEIVKKVEANPNPAIKAAVIFPNTIVRFGLNQMILKEKVMHSSIMADDTRIIVRR